MNPDDSRGLGAGYSMTELSARRFRPGSCDYWKRLTRRWREVAEWEKRSKRVICIGSCAGGQITWLVREAALDYRLSGDESGLSYVQDQIDKLADVYYRHPETWRERMGRTHPYWSEMHVCLAADMCRAGLDAEHRELLNRLVREHFVKAPYIGWDSGHRYLGGHNMAATEQVCAGICALVWGEEAGCAEGEAVVRRAVDSAFYYGLNGLDTQGFGYEGTMYMGIPMDVIYLFAELLHQNGRENLFQTLPPLKTHPSAIRSLLFPDRIGMAPIADGGVTNPEPYSWLLLTARHYDRPEDLGLWHAFRGPGRAAAPCTNNNPPPFWPDAGSTGPVRRDGWGEDLLPFLWWDPEAPMISIDQCRAPLSLCSKGTETAVFRTSWGSEAVHGVVLGQGRSHSALDHGHADAGHFTLFAHGEYLAIDTGYWNVTPDQHSLLIVDDVALPTPIGGMRCLKHRAGIIHSYEQGHFLDYVRVDAANSSGAIWQDRHFLFLRQGGDSACLIVMDNLNWDHGRHRYAWHLQAHPDSSIVITGPRSAEVRKARARLDVTFISPGPDDFPACPHEFRLMSDYMYGSYVQGHTEALVAAAGISRPYVYTEVEARREKSDVTYSSWYRPRLRAEQTGPNGLLFTVLSPRPAGSAPWTVKDRSGRRVFRVEIEADGFIDTVVAALDHGRIDFPDMKGWAELAVIRRDISGRRLDQWVYGGARQLTVS